MKDLQTRPWTRWIGYTSLALLLYLIFLIATLPAVWLTTAFERVSERTLRFGAASGTLWSGEGDLYAGGPVAGAQHLGKLRWSVNPLWLFLGRAQLGLQLNGPGARGQASVQLGYKNYAVQDLNLNLPASLAGLLYAPALFFQPSGTIELRSPGLEIDRTGITGQADVTWRGAGGRLEGAHNLGDYRIELKGTGQTASLQLTTLQGNLQLTGQGQWRVVGDGDLQFNGSASPTGEATALEPLLKNMGRDLGGGRRELRFNTRISLLR